MTFGEKIRSGRFLVTAELLPPRDASRDAVVKKAGFFKTGVDAVNVTDNQTALVRMSSIAAAGILVDQGIEPIVQMTCRDRNRIALQSDILGLPAMGIRNILCLTGDHPRFGDDPEARGVYDIDSIQLTAMARRMAEGFFLSGKDIRTPPDLCVGCAANPFAPPLEMRILRLKKKVEAGAKFIQTQPVFDSEGFRTWMKEVRRLKLHERTAMIAGIMPLKSVRSFIHLKDEVPGARIPAALLSRMEKAGDSAEEEGFQIAGDILMELRKEEGLRGIHIMPGAWESVVPRLAELAGGR
jgi:methylenetetrahydrofolate reductase (NADPH)